TTCAAKQGFNHASKAGCVSQRKNSARSLLWPPAILKPPHPTQQPSPTAPLQSPPPIAMFVAHSVLLGKATSRGRIHTTSEQSSSVQSLASRCSPPQPSVLFRK